MDQYFFITIYHDNITAFKTDKYIFFHIGIFASSGNLWKEHRTFSLYALRSFGFGKRSIENQVAEEVSNVLEVIENKSGNPFRMYDIISVAIANVICNITFGQRFEYDDTTFLAFLDMMSDIFVKGTVGAGIVSYFPWMRVLPGIRFSIFNIFRTQVILIWPDCKVFYLIFDKLLTCMIFHLHQSLSVL